MREPASRLGGHDSVPAPISCQVERGALRIRILLRIRSCGADTPVRDLSGAWLGESDLEEANLEMANLSGTYLGGAYLRKACFIAADFRGRNSLT